MSCSLLAVQNLTVNVHHTILMCIQTGTFQNVCSQEHIPCSSQPDGLYANYTSGCKIYYGCNNYNLVQSTACPLGTAFDVGSNSCQSHYHCIMPYCSINDYSSYVVPQSRCLRYYQCQGNGIAVEKICPPGFIFSSRLEQCTPNDEKCLEPSCVGRSDGIFTDDTTQNCKRTFRCRKGILKELSACPSGKKFNGTQCVSATSIKCSFQQTLAINESHNHCSRRPDGFYQVHGSYCKKYYFCSRGQTINKGFCSGNMVFNGNDCVPPTLYTCLEYYQSQCKSKRDGNYRDFSNCNSYYTCENGLFQQRKICGNNTVWSDDGYCVPNSPDLCSSTEIWPSCSTKHEGLHQDRSAESACKSYYYCFKNGLRTRLSCPANRVFNGSSCVSSSDYSCPTQDTNSCFQKHEGYYQERESGCRSYYYCSDSNKITYICPEKHVFNGRECVHEHLYSCPYGSEDCKNLSDGYYADKATKCHDYYFCLNGKRITTLTCSDNRIFNGERCVQSIEYACPGKLLSQAEMCNDKEDGYYADASSACTKYYNCLHGKLIAQHTCTRGYVYDGQKSCIPNKCNQHQDCKRNGFFIDYDSLCHDYYFCIDGKKTVLKCPGDRVFNGQLCVPKHSFPCQSECDRKRIKNGCNNNL